MTTPPLPPHLKAIKHRGEFEYPIQVWYLNLSVLALATVINVTSIAWTKLAPRFFPRSGSIQRKTFTPSRIPAALLTGWRIVAFRWKLPSGSLVDASLFEAFVVCVYMAALLIWEFVHTNNLAPAFWSNRAAHIAAAQLPLMPALSAKNNVIGLLTGISHERLNVLHRAAGRCIYVLVWVHFWGRWKIGFYGPDDIPHLPWQQIGAVSGAAYTLIILLSLRPFRRWSYEIFYFTHVVMVIVFVIAVCIHTTMPGFNYYVWPIWVVWGFERVVRGLRYLVINFILTPRAPTPSSAALSLITSDTLCVTLSRRMPLGWQPGQHAFLAFPRISSFPLESHPFSIASIPKRASAGSGNEQELMFIVRARDGVTGRMLRAVAAKPDARVSVQIDAPYGMPTDLAPYRTSVLVAGGTGVSYTLPLLLDLVQRSTDGKTRTNRIHFVWAVRSEAYLNWIAPYLRDAMSSCPAELNLEISLFVTDSSSDAGSIEEKRSIPELITSGDPEAGGGSSKDSPVLAEGSLPFSPTKGRPDVDRIITEEIARGQGPIAVEVSGPSGLVDAARSSVSSFREVVDVLKGGPTVNFHAEVFKY